MTATPIQTSVPVQSTVGTSKPPPPPTRTGSHSAAADSIQLSTIAQAALLEATETAAQTAS